MDVPIELTMAWSRYSLLLLKRMTDQQILEVAAELRASPEPASEPERQWNARMAEGLVMFVADRRAAQ